MKQIKLYIVILLLVVPSVALAAWWNPLSWGIWNNIFHKQTPITQHEINIPTSQIASWKTYKNSTFQFEVSYPKDWQISETNKTANGETLSVISPIIYDAPGYVSQGLRCQIIFNITTNQISFGGDSYYSPDLTKKYPETTINDTYCDPVAATFGSGLHGPALALNIFNSVKFYTDINSNNTINVPNFDDSSWKVYIDSKYGFQIKMPNGFKGSGNGFVGNNFFSSPQIEQNYEEAANQCENSGHPGVCVSMIDIYPDLIINAYQGEDINSENGDQNYWVKFNYITINGTTWKTFYPTNPDNISTDNAPGYYNYIFSKNGVVYSFYSPNDQLLQQILSTFKFTK